MELFPPSAGSDGEEGSSGLNWSILGKLEVKTPQMEVVWTEKRISWLCCCPAASPAGGAAEVQAAAPPAGRRTGV